MSKIVFDVDNEKKTINVLLPEPKILSHQLDMDSFQFYDVKKSVFTHVDLGDYAELQGTLMKKQETMLMQNEKFWDNLRENTKSLIANLITASGKIIDYQISYEWMDNG